MKGQYRHRDLNKNGNKCFMFLLSLCAILTVFCACFVIAIAFISGHLENNSYFSTRDYFRSAAAAALTPRRACSDCTWEREHRLPSDVQPELYDLTLNPDLTSGTFTGTVNITVSTTNTRNFVLVHTVGLTIHGTTFTPNNEPSRNVVQDAFEYFPNEFLVVTLKETVPPGVYNLNISFSGLLKDKIIGFYRSVYNDVTTGIKRQIATSKFEPTYARQAFPCFDEPGFKGKFKIQLVRPSTGNYIALSNMDQLNEIPDSPSVGLTTVNFNTSVPMSTYLACFIVCDFNRLPPKTSSQGFPVSVYARPGQTDNMQYTLDLAVATINYYISYFNIDYPLPKLDLISIPDFVSGAMEHWGLVTFRETSVLYNPLISSSSNQFQVSLTVAHELAHMWFGDLVTMKWWNDLWLNEGFASFMEYKGVSNFHQDWDVDSLFLIDSLHDVLGLDATLSSHPIVQNVSHPDQITEIFDTISYNKGASVIRMLERFMGEENFRLGVSEYLKTFAYKNAETQDLWNHLQTYSHGVNITAVMDTWTRQMGYPVVHVARDSNNRLTLSQTRFLADSSLQYDPNESIFGYKWEVPITYVTATSNVTVPVWLGLNQSTLTIDLPADVTWVKLNRHQVGYYRVNYSADDWNVLSTLLVNNPLVLDAADRANLLDDAFSLAEAGYIPYETALNMTNYLIKEDHYVPWSVASAKLRSLGDLLEFTPAYASYRKYVRKLIIPHITDSLWNISSTSSFLQRRRQAVLLSAACSMGVKLCLETAKSLFDSWLQNNTNKPHVDLRAIVYNHGMAQSGENEWEIVWQRYLSEEEPQEKVKLRTSLCSVKYPWILSRLIELSKQEEYVRSQDFFILLGSIADNPIGTPIVWDWMRDNWAYLVTRFTLNNRQFGRILPRVTSTFSTEAKLKELELFLKENPEEGAGAAGRKRAVENIKINIQWKVKHLTTLTEWFDKAAQ